MYSPKTSFINSMETTIALVVICCSPGFAKTPQQLKADLAGIMPSGKKARLVWSQGGAWNKSGNKNLYVVDSDDGIIRKLNTAMINAQNPQLTADGSRIVFGDLLSGKMYVINWDGSNQREIASGYCAEYWHDQSNNSDWVINSRGQISRINIDKPSEMVTLWNKGHGEEDGCALSPDGTRLAAWFEGSKGWGAGTVNLITNTLVPSGFGGCGLGIAPDNSYDIFVHWGVGHFGIQIINGTTSKGTYNTTDSILKWASINKYENTCHENSEFQDAKWTNNRDYITFSMFNTNANPFLYRLSDKKWIHIDDSLGCTYTHGLDVLFYAAGSLQTSAPKISEIGTVNALAAKPFEITVSVTGLPLPTLTATGLPTGVNIVNGSTAAQSFVISGTPAATGTFTVVLTAKNSAGNETKTFTLVVKNQNLTPTVNAGNDTSVTLGTTVRLKGSASDDGVPSPLQTTWSILSGPLDGAVISLPGQLASIITFSKAGTYVLKLTATDGAIAKGDTVTFTVTEGVPFFVTSPIEGDRLELGKTYTISWQMNTSEAVVIELSTDNGKSYEYLVFESFYQKTWLWEVPSDLPVSGTCFIKVSKYDQRSDQAISGKFALEKQGSAVINARQFRSGVAGKNAQLYSLDGRRAKAGTAGKGIRLVAGKHGAAAHIAKVSNP